MGGILLVVVLVLVVMPKGEQPPYLVLENPALGFRTEYPSELIRGPNYVKTAEGSILTVERFSLDMAKKDWVAQLPDVLFEQVLLQLQENYAYIKETRGTT